MNVTSASNESDDSKAINLPPRGLAIFAVVGPSFIWCAEYIGSGEVIIATRTGAILGNAIIWAVVIGIFLKYWIGLCGARYTACTGEGMIDMFSRIPGPKNWVVWITLIVQFISATISIGSIATAGGIFFSTLVPVSPYLAGWIVTAFCLAVAWSGGFNFLKILMTVFVFFIVAGVLFVAISVFPGFSEIFRSFKFIIPEVPQWAITKAGVSSNPWNEILPLLGWGAGGFASQVWYSYWVLGAGYGAAAGKKFGQPAVISALKSYDVKTAHKIKGWCRVVYVDATIGLVIGTVVTSGFLIAGAGVLGPQELAPKGAEVATTLARIFSGNWGAFGGIVFLFSATVALVSTQIGQLAGWPRLLADTFRICIPGFQQKYTWKKQFRGFLLFFLATNMIIVFTLGVKPVFMVQISAIMDGLLLTPLQALWVGLGLFVVMPKMFNKQVSDILKPHWILGLGLAIAFLVFGYFFIFQIPYIF